MKNSDLKKYIIKQSQTIYDAMFAINENWNEIVFVEDEDNKIIGTITDGDIRRGLLRGFELSTSVLKIMNSEFIFINEGVDRATVLDLMNARSVRQVPVLNQSSNLVGIHFMQDLLGITVKPNIAVIMAGGKGMRLRPLTENCPKPMIKVAGRPILERVILHLMGYGIRTIYIAINYLGNLIEEYFGDGSQFGCVIKYLHETVPLGTGGSLSLLDKLPEEPFIVMNGDLVTQVNISRLLDFHSMKEAEATIAVKPYKIDIPFGVVISENNNLVNLQEKPSAFYQINSGIYIFNPSVISYIPHNKEYPITSIFETLLDLKKNVSVYMLEEEWMDVGRYEELREANGILK